MNLPEEPIEEEEEEEEEEERGHAHRSSSYALQRQCMTTRGTRGAETGIQTQEGDEALPLLEAPV